MLFSVRREPATLHVLSCQLQTSCQPSPFPHPMWHTFSPTVSKPCRPTYPLIINEPSPKWNFSQHRSCFCLMATGSHHIKELCEWLICCDAWFIFPDVNLLFIVPNKPRHALYWGWRWAWWYWLHFWELLDWQLPTIWGSFPIHVPSQASQIPYREIRYTDSPSSPSSSTNSAWLRKGKR